MNEYQFSIVMNKLAYVRLKHENKMIRIQSFVKSIKIEQDSKTKRCNRLSLFNLSAKIAVRYTRQHRVAQIKYC